MDFSSIILFKEQGKDVTFDTLLKDIYITSKSKKEGIQAIVDLTIGKIKNAADAAMLGSTVVEYLEVGVKNDDQLVKLAQIVQRATARVSSKSESELGLTPEEILDLREDANRILEEANLALEEVQDR